MLAGGAIDEVRALVALNLGPDMPVMKAIGVATAANVVLTNWIPEMSVLEQAFLWENADQAHAAVDGKVGELITEAAKSKGLHVIGFMESGFRNTFSKNPITTPAEFQGVKIRTMQSPGQILAFESFGALPVALPAGEQFTALQQGTIDAAENATSNMLANRFYEVIKNHTTTQHAFVYIVITMSDDAWNKVPEDVRPAFLEAVKKGADAQRGYLVEANEAAKTELETNGVQFHEIDRDALKKRYQDAQAAKGVAYDAAWEAAVKEAQGK